MTLVAAFAVAGAWIGLRPTPDPAHSAGIDRTQPDTADALDLDVDAVPAEDVSKIELASHEGGANGQPSSPDPEISEDERQRRLVVGEWEDDYQGHRQLTIRGDGTATMLVKPSGIGSRIFAELLRFDIEWSFADGRIVMTTLGGEPKSKVQLITNIDGTRTQYQLLNLDEKQLLLLDSDGKTKYDWRRPPASPGAPGSAP
jgi:hypothetical protein